MHPKHAGRVEPSAGEWHTGRASIGIPEVPQDRLARWQYVMDVDVHWFCLSKCSQTNYIVQSAIYSSVYEVSSVLVAGFLFADVN